MNMKTLISFLVWVMYGGLLVSHLRFDQCGRRYACAAIVEHGDSGGRSASPVVLDLLHAAIVGNSGGQPNMVLDRYNLIGRNDEV